MSKRERTQPKPILFINKQAKKNFTDDIDPARDAFSSELPDVIAYGLEPTSPHAPLPWKTTELKKNGRPAYRCVYQIRPDCILIVHAFKKTTEHQDKKNLATVDLRLKAIDTKRFVS